MSRLAAATSGLAVLLAVPLFDLGPTLPSGRFGSPRPPEPSVPAAPAAPPPAVSLSLALLSPAAPALAHGLSSQAQDLRACFSDALGRVPGLEGAITVTVRVGADGHAQGQVQLDDVGDWRFTSCAEAAMETWVFPPERVGAPASLRFRARFGPGG